MSWFFKKNSQKSLQGGFTLLELIVVIVIILIMISVILSNLPALRSKIELDLIAQEIAITIRQAQAFSTSARGATGLEVIGSHGIYIDGTGANFFILFRDRNTPPDGYNPNPDCGMTGAECIEQFNIRGRVVIQNLECIHGRNSSPLTQDVQIIFTRPDPEASFRGPGSSNCSALSVIIGKTGLAGTENQRAITVWKSGHIYAGRI